jgi:alkylation response protein AidB-like acyl-CoA dehydrogenase
MTHNPKGGSFLIEGSESDDVFTPEDFSVEHQMIVETASGFVTKRIIPQMDDIESKKEGLSVQLLREFGELGFLGADIPEAYEGMEVDKICSTIISEEIGRSGSFCITHGGHTGIGSLPIVYFGNHEQKKKYLPDVVTGKRIAAYALTEPGAGTDALAIKTKAKLSPDGKYYILNGAKQFISNSAWADFFIVFAKIDGDKFSAFIVERDTEGFSTGPEEKKLGLKGSSTRSLYLDDVKVPVENLLFEIGKGYVVAFNILNIGRVKTAANSVGIAKAALDMSLAYANDRKQFNTPIVQFGLIKEKIAKMAYGIYAAESMLYRTSGLINDKLNNLDTKGPDGGRVIATGIEEYAVECSLNKVLASETLAYVVDEGIQIHGGYGFIADYPIERLYRDARIFKIFEGTNEINRNLIPTLLIRRANKGELPLFEAVEHVKKRLSYGVPERLDEGDLIQAAKDVFFYTLGAALGKLGDNLLKEQEILGRLADLVIATFAMESAWLRAKKAAQKKGEKAAGLKIKLARAFIYDSMEKLGLIAGQVLAAIAIGNELMTFRKDLSKLIHYKPINAITLNREIATEVSTVGKYSV